MRGPTGQEVLGKGEGWRCKQEGWSGDGLGKLFAGGEEVSEISRGWVGWVDGWMPLRSAPIAGVR